MQGVKDLTQGTIHEQLLRLAMPIMATSFIQMAYSLTDMAWIGRLGSESVAAVGTVGILTWMSSAIAMLSKVGSEVSVGQSIGAKNEKEARNFASHNVTIALIISLVWGSVLFFLAEPIISIYRLEAHISADAVSYLRIICTALPFYFLSSAFTGIYNASGRSNIPFYLSGTGLLLNILLDPIFIFVFDWGVDGAAYATCIAQFVVFGIFIYQLRHRNILLNKFPFIVTLQKKYSSRILSIGLPVALLNSLFAFANMFLSRISSAQGGHIGLMTFTTGGQIEAVTWNTSQGFATALGTFVAQNYAAGKNERVIKSWYTTLWITSIFGGICSILFIFFGNEIFSVFVPEEVAYTAGGTFLRIDGYSQLFMMLEIATQGIFYGIGRTTPPAIISIIFNYMRIPLALLFIHAGMGIEGIWWAVSITSIAKGIILTTWFILIKRRVIE